MEPSHSFQNTPKFQKSTKGKDVWMLKFIAIPNNQTPLDLENLPKETQLLFTLLAMTFAINRDVKYVNGKKKESVCSSTVHDTQVVWSFI